MMNEDNPEINKLIIVAGVAVAVAIIALIFSFYSLHKSNTNDNSSFQNVTEIMNVENITIVSNESLDTVRIDKRLDDLDLKADDLHNKFEALSEENNNLKSEITSLKFENSELKNNLAEEEVKSDKLLTREIFRKEIARNSFIVDGITEKIVSSDSKFSLISGTIKSLVRRQVPSSYWVIDDVTKIGDRKYSANAYTRMKITVPVPIIGSFPLNLYVHISGDIDVLTSTVSNLKFNSIDTE